MRVLGVGWSEVLTMFVLSQDIKSVRQVSATALYMAGGRQMPTPELASSTGSPASHEVEEGTEETSGIFESWLKPRMSWFQQELVRFDKVLQMSTHTITGQD